MSEGPANPTLFMALPEGATPFRDLRALAGCIHVRRDGGPISLTPAVACWNGSAPFAAFSIWRGKTPFADWLGLVAGPGLTLATLMAAIDAANPETNHPC
jgi:hypothetical protein